MAQQARLNLSMPYATVVGTFDLNDEGEPLDESRPVATSTQYAPDGSARRVEVYVVVTDYTPEEAAALQ